MNDALFGGEIMEKLAVGAELGGVASPTVHPNGRIRTTSWWALDEYGKDNVGDVTVTLTWARGMVLSGVTPRLGII